MGKMGKLKNWKGEKGMKWGEQISGIQHVIMGYDIWIYFISIAGALNEMKYFKNFVFFGSKI